jgi:hypothetical protein
MKLDRAKFDILLLIPIALVIFAIIFLLNCYNFVVGGLLVLKIGVM